MVRGSHAATETCAWRWCCTTNSARVLRQAPQHRKSGAHVEIKGDADDGEEPQYFVKPAHVPVQPAWVVVHEWLKYQVKGVDRNQREHVEEERLEDVGPDFRVAARRESGWTGEACQGKSGAYLDAVRTTTSHLNASNRPLRMHLVWSQSVS